MGADGIIDLDALAAALDRDTTVVSVMLANNEVGTIQPLDDVAAVVRRRAPNAVLHTDAVQAFPWLDVARLAGPADLVAVSAHKFGGPQGVGVLAVRRGRRGRSDHPRRGTGARPPFGYPQRGRHRRHGGRHAGDRGRPGRDRGPGRAHCGTGWPTICSSAVPGTTETGDRAAKIPGNCHLCFEGIESEALLLLLDEAGVCASAGSACASGAMEPSHVLTAMGIPKVKALGSLRLSLGTTTTADEVDLALKTIPDAVAQLRSGLGRVRVLVAMSGGVDSSVAAALLREAGHDVVGVTMKLWGGDSDTGCCSVADVEDARRVAQQLGIAHHVFNFTDDFDRDVVDPYVAGHAAGTTPNPCVACNRHLKFDRLLVRSRQLGFDAVATGHHARVVVVEDGSRRRYRLCRGADPAKDQSYVLHMLTQSELRRILLPVGELTKAAVRAHAAGLGLRTAAKPDSQDVCFITRAGGRGAFLGDRIPLHPGRLVEAGTGREVGQVPAVELVTVGQRRGMQIGAVRDGVDRRYALDVDIATATVTVGSLDDLLVDRIALTRTSWVDRVGWPGMPVEVQMSAHGRPVPGKLGDDGVVWLAERQRRVAPGQSVVLYDGDDVLGGGLAG